jgi:hypothetical protein
VSVTVRPRRVRLACRVAAVAVVAVFALTAAMLRRSTTAHLDTSDQVAAFALGLVVAAGVLLLGRPSVTADERGVRVRNILGQREVPWDVVRAVRFDDGSPWASLELVGDETVQLMAVQAVDGEPTAEAVAALRALLASSRGQG